MAFFSKTDPGTLRHREATIIFLWRAKILHDPNPLTSGPGVRGIEHSGRWRLSLRSTSTVARLRFVSAEHTREMGRKRRGTSGGKKKKGLRFSFFSVIVGKNTHVAPLRNGSVDFFYACFFFFKFSRKPHVSRIVCSGSTPRYLFL